MRTSQYGNPRIDEFKQMLLRLKEENQIKLLHRGMDKGFAFRLYRLNVKYNSIEQFAEQLFFFGEKSRYFWEQRFGNGITLNDTSSRIFRYIFQCLHEIAISTELKTGTQKFREVNRKSFDWFANQRNLQVFLRRIRSRSVDQRRRYRNYYLRIIHQLGETGYKKKSLHLSATENLSIARKFSHGQIVINFWDFDFNHFTAVGKGIPVFTGEPYKNQREISVFSAIFPHHIYSFYWGNSEYFNPALFREESPHSMIINGFTIDQTDFESRLMQTRFRRGVRTNNFAYQEVKPFTNHSRTKETSSDKLKR